MKIPENSSKYQPSGAGGTRSPSATPHRLPVGPKMADGVWKGVYPGRSKQLSLNKFFDPSTPFMRKGRDGGKKYVIASSRPPERRPLERHTLAPKVLNNYCDQLM